MINTNNITIERVTTSNDMTLVVDTNNRICVYNEIVNGCVFTNIDEFEITLENIKNDPESEYSTWGGKRGFLVYLKKHLKKEDKYFRKNKGMVTLKHHRYQEYCDDMVFYVALKHVVDGDLVSLMKRSEFEYIDTQLSCFNHEPFCMKSIN